MSILVVGDADRWEALQQRDFKGQAVQYQQSLAADADLAAYTYIIDLSLDDVSERAALYATYPDALVVGCIVKTSLAALQEAYYEGGKSFHIVGCNWLPGFITMPVLEISAINLPAYVKWQRLAALLDWDYKVIDGDTPGMVTPRVISMIINEAYFTAEEGTASREDIDLSMKLGTNYPYGPFELSQRIGLYNIYEVLKAVKAATALERYDICPLLEQEALTLKH